MPLSQQPTIWTDPGLGPKFGDLSGTSLGDFRLLKPLGEGGMGQVYLAQQISLRRKVALKLMRSQISACRRNHRRFQVEAETPARATHLVEIWGSREELLRHMKAESARLCRWSLAEDEGIVPNQSDAEEKSASVVLLENYATNTYRVGCRQDYQPNTDWLIRVIQLRRPFEVTIPWDRRLASTPSRFEKLKWTPFFGLKPSDSSLLPGRSS